MRILVTGGMGFIGKHLVRKLLEDPENKITIVDNLSSSKEDYEISKKTTFVRMGIENYIPALVKCKAEEFDQIYHLASPVGPVGVLKHSGQIGLMIIHGLALVATLANDRGAKLLDISTSEVYGKNPDNLKEGQKEDIPKTVPADYTVRLAYGVSKLLGEIELKNLTRRKGWEKFEYNIIRPFNIIGPDQSGELGFVVPRFIDQALKGESLTVYGDGTDLRTFTDVRDLVDAMILVMNGDVKGEIFNVGNPNNMAEIQSLALNIITLTESKSTTKFVDPKKLHGKYFAGAWNKIPNIDKIKKIGWEPKYTLEEALKECIISYKKGVK